MKHFTVIAVALLVCGTLLAIAYWIWPTPFTYETTTRPYSFGDGVGVGHFGEVWRINRFTGQSDKIIAAPVAPISSKR